MKISDDWEFNVLGITNYRKPGTKKYFFDFIIENHAYMDGDIVEAGVFRGRSLLATALLLKELGSDKKVYGYDTFSGFPPVYHANDEQEEFSRLLQEKRISPEHAARISKLKKLTALRFQQQITTANISQSGDFSDNLLEALQKKITALGLDNIVLVQGPFEETMHASGNGPEKVMAGLLDCDLYNSYRSALAFIWPRLEKGGYVFLDEYYSLKFPGARIATDEFFADKDDRPRRHITEPGDFERWYVRRLNG